MTLERFGTRLDDYLSGDLDPGTRAEIDALLAASPAAREEIAAYRRMVAALGELPDDIEPERDLLPEISARIDAVADAGQPPAVARRRRWLALAATLVAALGLAYLTAPWRRPAMRATPPPPAEPEVTLTAAAPPSTSTTRAQRDLLAATGELRRTLEEHRESLPPATLRLVEQNLEIIQGAIDEIQRAIDEDPANPELNRALVAYYQHELALLEQVGRVASRL